MELDYKLVKPIKEVNYLRAENVARYRVIIRYFFQEYEKIHYWLYREDIYEMMAKLNHFEDYNLEKCQSDLDALVEWGNLTALQDSAKVATIEEFKNKKYRYQLSEYTVEIERMTIKLENLQVEGASLEPTLLERIKNQIIQIEEVAESSLDLDIYSWWRSLNNDFIRLNQDYQDYIRTLNNAKAEEMMKSKEFLVFKEQLVIYLRTFIKNLQEHSLMIESYLVKISNATINKIFDAVVRYELSIPRIDNPITEFELYENLSGRWLSLYNWFVGENGNNEVNRLNNITNDIIRRITRYAQQIGEFAHRNSNRREEYKHIAEIFSKCNTIEDAHKLSAYVFGVGTSLHLKGLKNRLTDSIDSAVYEEFSNFISLEPRTRYIRKKEAREKPINYELDKRALKERILERQKQDETVISAYMKDNEINFETLPKINATTRKTLLNWLSRALNDADYTGKTETGKTFIVDITNRHKECLIRCNDGNFLMPCFKIQFLEGDE